MAIWEEDKHPRDKSGQFTSKGNEGQGGSEKKPQIKEKNKQIEIDDDYERAYGPAPDFEEEPEAYEKYVESYKKWKDQNDFDNDFEEEFLDIGEIVSDNEYVYFGIDDKDHFIDLLNKRDNVPIDKAKEWVEKNWDELQEYQNEEKPKEDKNNTPDELNQIFNDLTKKYNMSEDDYWKLVRTIEKANKSFGNKNKDDLPF